MPETTKRAKRKVRLGVVGGGPGSNIGETHRYAARLDDRYALVTGVFASDAERSRDFAATLDIAPDRRYGSWQEMAEQEVGPPDGLEVVSIMTPNNSHYAIAKAFLQQGIDVICDKPLTTDLEQALELMRLVRRTGLVFGVTYCYTGYPMVRQAREMIRSGELGESGCCRSSTPPAGLPPCWKRKDMSKRSGAPLPALPGNPAWLVTWGRTPIIWPALSPAWK